MAGPPRSLPAPTPTDLPAGVKALGPVQPGQILSHPAHSATLQSSVSPAVTQEGPYNIQPYTDIYDAADAYHQNNPTYAWLYGYNDTAAQRWWEAGAYNIDGYVGSAIYAYYDGQDMCMNVKGNVYAKGTQIWVSACSGGVQLNELWEFFAWNVNGVTMYTLCASYDTGLCINVKGGIAPGNLLIIWDLDELWINSLWQLYTA